eukprot:1194849-Prorocentrum_minimum.AAC.3
MVTASPSQCAPSRHRMLPSRRLSFGFDLDDEYSLYVERKYEDTSKGLREDGWEPELYTLVLGTLGELPSTAVQLLARQMNIQEEISRHEKLSDDPMRRPVRKTTTNKRKIRDQPDANH